MKQRKLTPRQTQALMRQVQGITDVKYLPTETQATTQVNGRVYKLIYDTNIQFTGVAYRLS